MGYACLGLSEPSFDALTWVWGDSLLLSVRAELEDFEFGKLGDGVGSLGPAGGDGGDVGGFEVFYVARVVLLCDFDGAVAQPALGVVDAVAHGDLTASILP